MSESLPPVKLATYEGPFDLLLELARAKKLDLSTVSLKEMTEAFLQYLQTNSIHPRLLGDFLVVASTLLLLKVRHLLPPATTDEPEVQELTDRLRIYHLYRQQATLIRQHWGRQPLVSRIPARSVTSGPAPCLLSITSNDLAHALQAVLARLPQPPQPARYTVATGRTLQECLRVLQSRLTQVNHLVFQEEIASDNRHTAAVSFLAVLELARQRHVALRQTRQCGDLIISRAP